MVIARLYYLISWLVYLLFIQKFNQIQFGSSQNGMSDLSDLSMYILSLCRADTNKTYLDVLDWYHVVIFII
jgi:hypothetical protein